MSLGNIENRFDFETNRTCFVHTDERIFSIRDKLKQMPIVHNRVSMLSHRNQFDSQLNKLEAKQTIVSVLFSVVSNLSTPTSPNRANSIINKTGCSVQTPINFMI